MAARSADQRVGVAEELLGAPRAREGLVLELVRRHEGWRVIGVWD
ncbi:hypothetical protein [Planotetraspora sp. GP83]